jgi:hypothetical protein
MHLVYRLYAMLCVVQAPLGLILAHEANAYKTGKQSLEALYVAASMCVSLFVPLYLQNEVHCSNVCFWVHVLCVESLFTAMCLTPQQLWLLCITRYVALATLCTCGKGTPRPLVGLHLGLYLFVLTQAVVHSAAQTFVWPTLLVLQAALDTLLFVGHQWDSEYEEQVQLNAKLFYVCCSSILLHTGFVVSIQR